MMETLPLPTNAMLARGAGLMRFSDNVRWFDSTGVEMPVTNEEAYRTGQPVYILDEGHGVRRGERHYRTYILWGGRWERGMFLAESSFVPMVPSSEDVT